MSEDFEFRVVPHSIRPVKIVEVWYRGKFVATVTPISELPGVPGTVGVGIISKYYSDIFNVDAEQGGGVYVMLDLTGE